MITNNQLFRTYLQFPNMRLFRFVILFALFVPWMLSAQIASDYSASNIRQALEQLNTFGTVLYIAAHPDDENTRLIAYLSNGMHLRTGYLSATRGDGGQNLIGPEIRESLGVIRTNELLGARALDGGFQFFSRANDFGYSKHPDETFNVWNKEQVLADFVWVIRNFRPDIIVTRFSEEPGVTHGHHTGSAILAHEAYKLAGDSTAFSDQLQWVAPWQPKKIFWNVSMWQFRRSGKTVDTSKFLSLNVGDYNPVLGMSYTEIAAKSRSMHKSQGFGSSSSRGVEYEYLQQWEGEPSDEFMDGIETSWKKIPGSEAAAYHAMRALDMFDPDQPITILGSIIELRKELLKLSDGYWKEVKLKEVDDLILKLTGTYISISATELTYTPGDSIQLNFEIINRSEAPLKLSSLGFGFDKNVFKYGLELEENQQTVFSYQLVLPEGKEISHPYWLQKPSETGMYTVSDQQLIGLPNNPPPLKARVTLEIEDQHLDYYVPIDFQKTDPVKGEVHQPIAITPKVMVNVDQKAMIFIGNESRDVPVKVTAGTNSIAGKVLLEVPSGWKVVPEALEFDLDQKGEEQTFVFKIQATEDAESGMLTARAIDQGGSQYERGIQVIDYDHIPRQTLFPVSQTPIVKLNAEIQVKNVGYINGAGDEIPASLIQIGINVDVLEKEDLRADQLSQYDALILGIRAFNTRPWLAYKNKELFEYVENGGTLIAQYNTSHRLVTEEVAPLPLKLSHDRVTVEEAPVTFIDGKHPVLNYPNKITLNDFEDWVQERGLYFPDEWDDAFVPILSMNDPGESTKKGALLVAPYGKGYYCYTGLSFFRELPAGVPGAYRLLINMLHLGAQQKPK